MHSLMPTFMTTMGSTNWLTCGAQAKMTARPSFMGKILWRPPMDISRKYRSIIPNQKEHTALRTLTFSRRYMSTHTMLTHCPTTG